VALATAASRRCLRSVQEVSYEYRYQRRCVRQRQSKSNRIAPRITPRRLALPVCIGMPRGFQPWRQKRCGTRLPKLDDDDEIGVEKDHVVTRDDKADLKFRGTLLASIASSAAPRGRWREFRVYKTVAGNYVYSDIGRSVLDGERDKFRAEVVNLNVTHYVPMTWQEQAINFFGFDPLAKDLYRKLGVEFEEKIG